MKSSTNLKFIWLATLLALSGCATTREVVATSDCPQLPARTVQLQIPGPDPLWFPQCFQELKAKALGEDPMSAQKLTPSCERLRQWQGSIDSLSNSLLPR